MRESYDSFDSLTRDEHDNLQKRRKFNKPDMLRDGLKDPQTSQVDVHISATPGSNNFHSRLANISSSKTEKYIPGGILDKKRLFDIGRRDPLYVKASFFEGSADRLPVIGCNL
ncbi:unnamed protein product, partial [marine sediment metagenome]